MGTLQTNIQNKVTFHWRGVHYKNMEEENGLNKIKTDPTEINIQKYYNGRVQRSTIRLKCSRENIKIDQLCCLVSD